MDTLNQSLTEMSIDELLTELIDKSKRQFIYGCGMFPSGLHMIDKTDVRINDLCDEIRKRVQEKSE